LNWEAIGAIGDFVGGIAVILTLAFLAFQIFQNTKATKAGTVASYMQAYGAVASRIASTTEMARLIRLGHADPKSLSLDEAHQFFAHLSEFMVLWESLWRMKEAGQVEKDHWQTVREDIVATLSSAGGQQYLESVLPIYTKNMPAFSKELQACLEEQPVFRNHIT